MDKIYVVFDCCNRDTFWITFGLDRTFMAFGSTTTIGRRWEIVMTINV